jgi:hypothetical protein
MFWPEGATVYDWYRPGIWGLLRCRHRRCRRNPRPSIEVAAALMTMAAKQPDGRLDLSLLDL